MKYSFDNVLVVGAHPDDIEIGCGATISKWYANNIDITCIIMSCENDIRLKETLNAFEALNIPKSNIIIGGFTDGNIPHNKISVSLLDKYVNKRTLILTHNEKDSHQDHKNTCLSAMSAGRNSLNFLQWPTVPFKRINLNESILPSMYVCVDGFMKKKIKSISCHKSQFNRFPKNWDKLVKKDAYIKGINSNCKYSESFYLKKYTI